MVVVRVVKVNFSMVKPLVASSWCNLEKMTFASKNSHGKNHLEYVPVILIGSCLVVECQSVLVRASAEIPYSWLQVFPFA